LYDLNLALPFISAIRRQEARAVGALVARYGDRTGRALEVGPGTGFYTLSLAQAFREVIAVEECAAMAQILTDKLAAMRVDNVTVINADFRTLPLGMISTSRPRSACWTTSSIPPRLSLSCARRRGAR